MADEDEAPDCPDCPVCPPSWLATFADLMSLLMCFFVLLLSFAEMDALKFKRLAGELRMAFGVQTVINADDPPKGTSVIAKHFSPSIPEPTPINEIRQKTSDVTKSSLEVLCQDAITAQTEAQGDTGKKTREVFVPTEQTVTQEQVEDAALEMASELEQEISKGKVELETQGNKIIIRITENSSFKGGSAYVEDEFLPVLDKIREVLVELPGRISVEGHTDNTPLGGGGQYRSNWELSAARAASVAQYLFVAPEMDEKRFMVVGHGSVRPLVDNRTAENREKNRRVEIIIVKSDERDNDDEPEISDSDNPFSDQLNAAPEDFGLDPDEVF
ncbi:flagellar motor protein MotB [Oceaniserpentilla sp. 4NH20-0058]|uniref:flagellar motor protein MotB n=1 Tax=Oceaniserpentilla sp. 4NH20-0058 TaxID=3127660 RepID=UPI0031086B87